MPKPTNKERIFFGKKTTYITVFFSAGKDIITWITSGAIQNGVPITVFLFAIVS